MINFSYQILCIYCCGDRGAFEDSTMTDFFFGFILSLRSTLTVRFFFDGGVIKLATRPVSAASSVNTDFLIY